MNSPRLDLRPLFPLGLVVVLLAGCASSPPSMFYQLSPFQNRTAIARDASLERTEMVAVGPVRIPDYLERPQIVTRAGKNELRLAEFDRWAGSLESDVTRVLVEDISSLLPYERFSAVPWTPYLESQLPASYRVEVLVERFDGRLGDSVLLKAQWAVFAKNRSMLLKRESLIREQIDGGGYDALVAAMSGALEKLSSDISVGILSVLPPEAPR
jgi:uncharacterized lipoprotein YmbA